MISGFRSYELTLTGFVRSFNEVKSEVVPFDLSLCASNEQSGKEYFVLCVIVSLRQQK